MSKKYLPISISWRCFVFSFRKFSFHIKAYVPNQINFCAQYERKVEFVFPLGRVTPSCLVQSTLLFPLNCVGVLNETYWPYGQQLYKFLLCFTIYLFTLWLPSSKFYSKSWNHVLLSAPTLFLFFKMVMTISDPLNFYINFRFYLPTLLHLFLCIEVFLLF